MSYIPMRVCQKCGERKKLDGARVAGKLFICAECRVKK